MSWLLVLTGSAIAGLGVLVSVQNFGVRPMLAIAVGVVLAVFGLVRMRTQANRAAGFATLLAAPFVYIVALAAFWIVAGIVARIIQ